MEKILAKNKKAFHDYHILDIFEAGIELKGTEVKSCRAGSISLNDAYAKTEGVQIFLYNSHIAVYEAGNRFNHDPLRSRRLLLHAREIRKLAQSTREKGATIIPLKFYLKGDKIKVEIGLAKGKTHGDKRETLREKQAQKDIKRAIASRKK